MNSRSVGLGEIVVSRDPEDILVAYGLGSCLGIGFFDPIRKVAGLLHAVLPEHTPGRDDPSGKYVNTGVSLLLDMISREGGDPKRCILRIAGGANMLVSPGLSNTFDIGTRNINSALQVFKNLNMKIVNQDVGGTKGRTVRLYVADGRMTVRVIGQQEKDI